MKTTLFQPSVAKSGVPTVTGVEQAASAMRWLRESLGEVRDELAMCRLEVLSAAEKLRWEIEDTGTVCNRVNIATLDGKPVPVSYPRSWQPISLEHHALLVEALGFEGMARAFRIEHVVKLRKNVDLAMLKVAAGDRWKDIAPFFDIEEAILPVPDFADQRVKLGMAHPEMVPVLRAVDQRRMTPKVRLV
jgi:hypothetical protein